MWNKIFIAVVLQVLIFISIIVYYQNTPDDGERIVLTAHPIDPTFLVDGDFVRLFYDITTLGTVKLGTKETFKTGDTVYVSLRKEADGTYLPSAMGTTAPEGASFIKGQVTNTTDMSIYRVITVIDDSGQEHDFETRFPFSVQANTHYVFCLDRWGHLYSLHTSGSEPGTFFVCSSGFTSVYGTLEKESTRTDVQVRAAYGIEKFFVEKGHPLNIGSAYKITADVYLSKKGKAVLKNLMVNGKEL